MLPSENKIILNDKSNLTNNDKINKNITFQLQLNNTDFNYVVDRTIFMMSKFTDEEYKIIFENIKKEHTINNPNNNIDIQIKYIIDETIYKMSKLTKEDCKKLIENIKKIHPEWK
jgi:hypothetical protein